MYLCLCFYVIDKMSVLISCSSFVSLFAYLLVYKLALSRPQRRDSYQFLEWSWFFML